MSLLEYAQLVLAGLAGVSILAASSRAAAAPRGAGTDAAFWYCFAGAAAALVPLLWAYSLGPAAGGTVLALLLLAGIPAAAHVLKTNRRPVPPDPAWQPAADTHAALAARWLAHELNPAPPPGAEVLTDPAAPATAAMVRALVRANKLRPDPSALPAAQRTSAYILAVAEFSRRLDEAEAAAGISRTAGL
jgi:hypothetical protein